jgi:hypothetical protein
VSNLRLQDGPCEALSEYTPGAVSAAMCRRLQSSREELLPCHSHQPWLSSIENSIVSEPCPVRAIRRF